MPTRWTPTPAASRASLTLHASVGVLSALLTAWLYHSAPQLPITTAILCLLALALPHGLAAPIGYSILLSDDRALPRDEPCLRSGSWGDRHWFEFASMPHRRLWTHDAREAARVRSQPVPEPVGEGFEVALDPAPDERPLAHLDAAGRTMFHAFLGLSISVWGAGALTVLSEAWPAAPTMEALATMGCVALSVWLYAIGGFVAVFWSVYAVVSVLWNSVLSRSSVGRIRWTQSALHTPNGDIVLAEPGLGAAMDYHPHGAQLDVWNRRQHLTLYGDHDMLAKVRRMVERRSRGGGDGEREAIPCALHAAMARSARRTTEQ